MISLTWMYHARQLNGNTYTITGIPTISVRGSSCDVTKAKTFLVAIDLYVKLATFCALSMKRLF